MYVPEALLSLIDHGVIDEVVRPLKSGKEAQVFLVYSDGEARVAKVYKDAQERSFKQRAQYMEGRRVRNTRDRRAMERRSRHGKAQEEAAWKSAEVNIIYRLHDQGVRVPTPHNFIDGVLIMELVRGDDGEPAPRLSELALDAGTAQAIYEQLLREVIKMLCAGIVHGDLSDYNVLIDANGPVVIDFPQSVDASQNRNARRLLIRDVDNLGAFLNRCVPGARQRPYGQEIWSAYESNMLTPDLELRGRFRRSSKPTNMSALLDEIEDAEKDERRRREATGEPGPRPRRREVLIVQEGASEDQRGGRRRKRGGQGGGRGGRGGQARSGRGGQSRSGQGQSRSGQGQSGGRRDGRSAPREQARAADGEGPPKRRRRRRRGGGGGGAPNAPRAQRSERTAQGERPNANQSTPEAEGGAPKPRRRRRRRRRKGPGDERAETSRNERTE